MPKILSVEERNGKMLSTEQIEEMRRRVVGWAILHGVQQTVTTNEFPERVESEPVTLFPSILPKEEYEKAKSLQTGFQTVIYKAANDHKFMTHCFANIVREDDFIRQLWEIYDQIREEGPAQKVSLLLTRNDFMLEYDGNGSGKYDDGGSGKYDDCGSGKLSCKQVEINTIAAGCGTVSEVHRYSLCLADIPFMDDQLEENRPTAGLAKGLVKAWQLYNKQHSVILFVVSVPEPNTPDHRQVEFDIFRLDRSIKVMHRSFSQLMQQMAIGDNKELIVDGQEVAIVYYRHGYSPDHYPTDAEFKLRLDLERSRAIKCPTVALQLAGCKKVQQALAEPGVLEKYLHDKDMVKQLRSTFVGLYNLDSEESTEIISKALKSPERFVLKPQREGGGNNLFGEELRVELDRIKELPERSTWILMDRINCARNRNRLIRSGVSPEIKNVINEFGILGVHISTPDEEIENYPCGYMMRTKPEHADEGGIFHGSACLDSIFLV